MTVIMIHYGMGNTGSRLIDYIRRTYSTEKVNAVKLEPLEQHGFYGWLLRSFVPGLKSPVKPVDLKGYRIVYLLAPKWSYNCPPINGFLDSHELRGLSIVLIVTYTKGSVSGYAGRIAKKIREKGANLLGTLTLKREELLSDQFPDRLSVLLQKADPQTLRA